MKVPFTTGKWPCPLEDEIPGLEDCYFVIHFMVQTGVTGVYVTKLLWLMFSVNHKFMGKCTYTSWLVVYIYF